MAYNFLNADDDALERMENDLITKVGVALIASSIDQTVHGVFSIDDLEYKTRADLCQKIGVGVGYAGAEPTGLRSDPKSQLNAGNDVAAKTVDFVFHIILVVPSSPECDERKPAAKLLTVLRRSIPGTKVSGDPGRGWAFVREGPDISESTENLLYYVQVWRLPIIAVGPAVT